ncbi:MULTISPECIES: hypothetical protein [Francisella]|uniref:Lipoprotein n=1 Tax=Francisella salimarina TaxID=2599927 RepID=A0AAJ4TKC2_9GAMM|nr:MULTISPECIES: hypothetical protein [Francisella]QWU98547.1 hypothetical protein KQR59_05375 [Francisella salimarina]
MKKKKSNKLLILALSVVLLSSCTTTKKDVTKIKFASYNYPWIFAPVRKNLVEDNISEAINENNNIANIKQLKNLNNLESGRLLQLNDNYLDSIKFYDLAIKSIPKDKDQSLEQAKKFLLNKNTYNYYDIKTSYNIPDYAISFLYTYQALNYLKTNDVNQALKSLDSLETAKIWRNEQNIIAGGMKELAKEDLDRNDITSDELGLDNFKSLKAMLEFSSIIPNAYGNPMAYYLKSLLDSAISKNYQESLNDLENAQKYTIGNKYLDQTANEYRSAVAGEISPFSMGMGRVVVFYEQGLVNIRKSAQVNLDLGNIGIKKLEFPVYKTKYSFFEPKRVVISSGGSALVDTYTETLLDTTLYAMKSLIESYSRVVTQSVVIEAFKYDYDKNFPLGGLLGSHLKFDLSNTDPKRADMRSWLLLPNSIDLFEQQIDSGNYTIQVNNIRQKIDVKQGKTTLLWIVDIGKFKKVYYFIF